MYYVKSPVRIDLVGGTLDLWPISSFFKSTWTWNAPIDLYTEVWLYPQHSDQIEINSEDYHQCWKFESLEELKNTKNQSVFLFKEVIDFFQPLSGFLLKVKSHSPVGGGLGASSSLIISLLKVFHLWLNQEQYKNFSVHDWVTIAHNIEARILKTPTGTQDYYPAFQGRGIQGIHYLDQGTKLFSCHLDDIHFLKNYFLVDTGRSHHSGLNNFDVLRRLVAGESQTWKALEQIKRVSDQVTDYIFSKKKISWIDIFNQEYEARLQLSPSFSSPEIEKLKILVHEFDSQNCSAIKILGAGGGGCVLVVNDLSDGRALQNFLQQEGFSVINFNFLD